MTDDYRIGIDLGGTKISAGIVDTDGAVTEFRSMPTPAQEGAHRIVASIAELVDPLLARAPGFVGIGSAGTISASGEVVAATDAIREWRGFPLADALGALLGHEVVAVNDVHAAAYAEARLGAGVDARVLLVVTIGTGVGGAMVVDQQVLSGRTGAAGSIGHLPIRAAGDARCGCGRLGHLEAIASGPAMEAEYARRDGRRATLIDIADRAQAGDPLATAVIREGAHGLGSALAAAMCLLDADRVVLGGGVASIGDAYFTAVREQYAEDATVGPPADAIIAASFGTSATLVGAGLLAAAPSPHRR